MPKVHIMIGCPASGKSTYAKNLEGIYVSSDEIREELFGDASIQGNPAMIFNIFYNRAAVAFEEGYDVILDATNINKKNRKKIYSVFGDEAEYIAHYFNPSIETLLERNAARERVVPEDVIRRMKNQLEYPNENWIDEVIEIQ